MEPCIAVMEVSYQVHWKLVSCEFKFIPRIRGERNDFLEYMKFNILN